MKAHSVEQIIDAALDQYVPGIENDASRFQALVFQRALKSFLAMGASGYPCDGCNHVGSQQLRQRAVALIEKARKQQIVDSGFVVDDGHTSGLRILTALK
ncbi:hypothetical protein BJF92_13675 [Rhizobium rhizosphaerae]|uniref:Uncharacterized protein n=1 Tax=Xaviernesmea rhizosphaerae TaxID=1672749 RepID=A0A1Q9AI26_9HYPH|nr:hypothetical protein [Xaviernesmea rhizosphaerae]OLP54854.1 hypothetical protein BJF92_13675 [Xaviernesmea rhizosphaerae]